jgi:crotonobetainyl-CoA:carnitine CoA-transferase CaiB-like acyl-CoA transferase
MIKPFEGIKVIDLTHVLAGPFCTYQLAVLGADTIKIESPDWPDQVRTSGTDQALNKRLMGTNYLSQGANKRCMTLNLKMEKGRDVLKRMVSEADVMVENYRAGAMTNLGLGYEDIEPINPRLIYCSMTGYGHTGPKAEITAYDTMIQAASGMMSVTGTPETAPLKVGAPIVDYASGTMAAFAIASALLQRERTGAGQFIDFSMLDTAMILLSSTVTGYLYNGDVMSIPRGNDFSRAGGCGFTAKDGGIVMLGALNTRQFERLWNALGRPDLAAQSSYDEMDAHNEMLKEELTRIFVTRTAAEWEEFFDQAHVPAARVNTIPEALALEQLRHRENLLHFFDTVPGTEKPVTVPVAGFRYAHGGPSVEMPPSQMGAHTEEVLRELGYDGEHIAILRREGVI